MVTSHMPQPSPEDNAKRIEEAGRLHRHPGEVGPILRRFLDRVTLTLVRTTRLRAPFKTGRAQDSITRSVDSSILPLWARVFSTLRSPSDSKGRVYPLILEQSTRTHYRATIRKGQPTRAWFSSGINDAEPDLQIFAADAQREIADLWRP